MARSALRAMRERPVQETCADIGVRVTRTSVALAIESAAWVIGVRIVELAVFRTDFGDAHCEARSNPRRGDRWSSLLTFRLCIG
jgi:hypothetical protein